MPRKTDSSNPADWLFFAGEDVAAVSLLAERQISFHVCQSKLAEALEKLLKAELVSRGWFLEKVHDLQKLMDELHVRASDIEKRAQPLAEALADAYFSDRYPGFDIEDPDWPELKRQLSEVSALLDHVQVRIQAAEGLPAAIDTENLP